MKKVLIASLAFLLSTILMTGQGFAQDSQASTKREKGAKHLYNGKNFKGWYKFIRDRGRDTDPKNVFTVQDDGILRISGEEWGCITTEKEYENYKLVLEYKWGDETHGARADRARDNGLLFHSQGEDGGYSGVWMHSIECNIIEGGTGDFIVVGDGTDRFSISSPVAAEKQGSSYIFKPGGDLATINKGRINWFARDPDWKDVLGFRGSADIEKPVGEWNRLECVLDGDNISIYLNGVLVNQAMNVKPSKGKIQLQSEGAEMFVRKLDLIPLKKK